jgi:cellulose synthase/poly-beta-1,6-N-acetylglucosamine synthase-like glycosyltransferase
MINYPKIDNRTEMLLTRICIGSSLLLFLGVFVTIFNNAHEAYETHHTKLFMEALAFGTAIFFMAYGNLLYQVCLLGYYKRKEAHVPDSRDALNTLYLGKAPSLTVLIPSYKEEHGVVWQTLMSAALSEYPHKNVVLLVDDPYRSKSLEDMAKLEETRLIPIALQEKFNAECVRYRHELEAFRERKAKGNVHNAVELNRISMLYDDVSEWLRNLYRDFARAEISIR